MALGDSRPPSKPERFCTKSLRAAERLAQNSLPPYFFLGTRPSLVRKAINPTYPAAGVMLSRALFDRKSNFQIDVPWLFDSGAFTEISQFGCHRLSATERARQVSRWAQCGELLAAVSQDWMCEPTVIQRTGGTVRQHQKLTLERYDELLETTPDHIYTLPVLQGWEPEDYCEHLEAYGNRLLLGAWVGVGSVCRRGKVGEIEEILKAIHNLRPDLRLHGFGLKLQALASPAVRQLLFSCDSMAGAFARKFGSTKTEIGLCWDYQEKVTLALAGTYSRTTPKTAGPENGQGRKGAWSGPTVPVRLPKTFRNGRSLEDLLQIARKWDSPL